MIIPDICQFWDTTTLLRPVKGAELSAMIMICTEIKILARQWCNAISMVITESKMMSVKPHRWQNWPRRWNYDCTTGAWTSVYRCLWTPKWICETVCMLLFSHQDRNVTVRTAHSMCTVYTRVAALLAAQMTPPEIKLNYRRFSRTMIQREMKVNFDFSMLLMVEKVRL